MLFTETNYCLAANVGGYNTRVSRFISLGNPKRRKLWYNCTLFLNTTIRAALAEDLNKHEGYEKNNYDVLRCAIFKIKLTFWSSEAQSAIKTARLPLSGLVGSPRFTHTWDGMIPLRFKSATDMKINFFSCPSWLGKVPVKWLLSNCKNLRSLNSPILVDIVPLNKSKKWF